MVSYLATNMEFSPLAAVFTWSRRDPGKKRRAIQCQLYVCVCTKPLMCDFPTPQRSDAPKRYGSIPRQPREMTSGMAAPASCHAMSASPLRTGRADGGGPPTDQTRRARCRRPLCRCCSLLFVILTFQLNF